MSIVRTALLAAAASMIAAAAFAQTSSQPMGPADSSQSMPAPTYNSQTAPGDTNSAPMTNMSQPATPDSMAPTGSASDTSATVDANGVVWHSAAPIPDTPANRAADGQPLSRTGKLTPPIGN